MDLKKKQDAWEDTENQSLDQSRLYELCQSCRQIQTETQFRNRLHLVLSDFQNLVPSENLILMMYHEENDSLQPGAIVRLHPDLIPVIHEHIKNTSLANPIQTKEPADINLPIATLFGVSNEEHANHGSSLSIPVLYGAHCLGLLIFDRPGASFSRAEIQAAELFANHLAIAGYQCHHDYTEERVFKRYQDLFERIHVPLFYCGVSGELMCANQAFYDLLDCEDKSKFKNPNIFDRIHFSQSENNSFRQLLQSCGFFKNLQVTIDTLSGRRITALISIIPLYVGAKKVKGYEGVIQDITETLQREAQLVQAQKLGALGSLTGGVAHDFNNLIGGIIGCTDMLMHEMHRDSPLYADVQTIMSAAKKAAGLTNQLLAFVRKATYVKEACGMREMLKDLALLLSRILPKNLMIETDIHDDLYPVYANRSRLEQAIMNLCINARDAMPDGGRLIIHASNVRLSDNKSFSQTGDHVRIQIKDTGCGIDETIQSQIFEPFFTTKSVHQGSGLGLSIVKEIIENHHGDIMIQSHPETGTTVDIRIPAMPSPDAEMADSETSRVSQSGTETILLVDDEEVIRRMSKRMLERYGYHIIIAENGLEALKIYKQSPDQIDLVILDMIMPKLDGRRTLKQLKQLNSSVKTLLFSGNITEEALALCMAEGFQGFIPKPFETNEMLDTVRQTLDMG